MNVGNTRPRVALFTFGCRVNQYETQMMRGLLATTFDVVDRKADLYVVNACTVTSLAERKARQAIRRLRREHPGAKIVLIGCLADAVAQSLTRVEGADLLGGNAWKGRIDEVVTRALAGEHGMLPAVGKIPLAKERIEQYRGRVRALIKVQDGCSLSCTFCRTTQVRGPSRSKSIAAALSEARSLVQSGYPEIVITGINLAQYAPPDGDLAELVQSMLKVDGLRRLRLGSINPYGITERLVKVFSTDHRACPYFHIPLQSGDDVVLRRMERGYTTSFYRSRISLIRRFIPKATFGADVIVGFPGEGEAAFARTCEIVEEVGFANLHIFRYSRRDGTFAANLPNHVKESKKRERVEHLRELARAICCDLHQRFLGSKEEVLIEERRDGKWRGYTQGYIDTYLLKGDGVAAGDEVTVKIEKATDCYLEGVIKDRTDTR